MYTYIDFSDPCTEVYPSSVTVPIPSPYRPRPIPDRPRPSPTVPNRPQPFLIVLSYFNIFHIYIRVFLKMIGKNNQNEYKYSSIFINYCPKMLSLWKLWWEKIFPFFFGKGPPFLWKLGKKFLSSRYENSYTNRKPLPSLVEIWYF